MGIERKETLREANERRRREAIAIQERYARTNPKVKPFAPDLEYGKRGPQKKTASPTEVKDPTFDKRFKRMKKKGRQRFSGKFANS